MSDEAAAAISALASPGPVGSRSVTSDLSIDESLLLHSAGWEPTDLVTGVAVWSIPYGVWAYSSGYGQSDTAELSYASEATMEAFRAAVASLRDDCSRSGGHGVVGVDVEVSVEGTYVKIAFAGTAIRPLSGRDKVGMPFVTDLSTKDYVLLARAGWEPVDLAYGASFVSAPFQHLRQFMAQAAQNVELVNLTKALQDARELAMERLQHAAAAAGVSGVVDVSIIDGPLHHSSHVISFICWGTSVRLVAERHQRIEPELVVPLNDVEEGFEATSLRSSKHRR